MIAYKAVHKDMHSEFGNQPVYEVGRTYRFPLAARGVGGFHAAEDPLFCLGFIPPNRGRYLKVDLSGSLDASGCANGDTAAAATTMTILEELSVEQMLWEAVRYRFAWACKTVTDKKEVTGERLLAIADKIPSVSVTGERCIAYAKGTDTCAKACGRHCLAVAEGKGATAEVSGHDAIALAFPGAKASVSKGGYLLRVDNKNRIHLVEPTFSS